MASSFIFYPFRVSDHSIPKINDSSLFACSRKVSIIIPKSMSFHERVVLFEVSVSHCMEILNLCHPARTLLGGYGQGGGLSSLFFKIQTVIM